MINNPTSTVYVAPSLRKMGRLETLTSGTSTGQSSDASFPSGTPFSQVTFS